MRPGGEGREGETEGGTAKLPSPLSFSLSPLPTRKQSLLPIQGGYRREGGGRFCYRASSSLPPPLSLRPTRQSFRLFWRRLFEVFPLGFSAWKTRKRPPPPAVLPPLPKKKDICTRSGSISPCFFQGFFLSSLPPSVFFFLEFVLLRKWFFWPLKNVGEGRTGKEEEEEWALHRRLPSPSVRRSVPSPFVRRQRAG